MPYHRETNGQNNSDVRSGVTEIERDNNDFESLFSLERLRRTWNSLRRELKYTSARDVIDWADWAITIENSLPLIREDILNGNYKPSNSTRIESGKNKGRI